METAELAPDPGTLHPGRAPCSSGRQKPTLRFQGRFFFVPFAPFYAKPPPAGLPGSEAHRCRPSPARESPKSPEKLREEPSGGTGGGLGAQRRGRSPRPLNKPGRPAHLPAVLGCVVLCCVASFLPSLPPSSAVSPAGLPTPRGGAGGCARPAPGRAPPHPPPPQLRHVPSKGPRPFPRWQGTPRPAKYPAFCCLVNFKPSSSRL